MNSIKICIVGSGPAGFYAAQHLLKKLPTSKVDLYEKLPVPYGLVRYGVAPDHPEVKNVINTFKKTASHSNFNFFGNVSLGVDLNIKQLQDAYNIVLLTYGASKDKLLGIPGETLDNVISARRFVGWYNGNPEDQDLNPTLQPSITILGQGNVAIDVARILLSPIDQLKETDITDKALYTLITSPVREVNIVGRRGPVQAAFTIKELREMIKLPNVSTLWRETDFEGVEEIVPKLQRPRKRITELMLNSINSQKEIKRISPKIFSPIFYRAPIDISESSVKLAKTMLMGDMSSSNARAVTTNDVEFLKTDLVIRSIGYKSINIDPLIPFDDKLGCIKNKDGRVAPGLYTTGWLGHGPTGVILTTMNNSFAVANHICDDLNSNASLGAHKPGSEYTLDVLKEKNIQVVKWEDWEKIDEYEINEGKKLGKCREKVTDINKMLEIAS